MLVSYVLGSFHWCPWFLGLRLSSFKLDSICLRDFWWAGKKKNKLSKTIFPQGHNPLLYVSKNILSISELPLTANACFFKPPVSELSFTFLALKLLALKYKWMYYLSMLKEEKSKVFKLSKKKKKKNFKWPNLQYELVKEVFISEIQNKFSFHFVTRNCFCL